MNIFRLTVLTSMVLGFVGFFGSPLFITLAILYTGRKFVSVSAWDELAPNFSFALLMVLCSVSAGVLFSAYTGWYKKEPSRLTFLAVLAATIAVALAGIWLNIYQLKDMVVGTQLPIHASLSMTSLAYFEWGVWPTVVFTMIAVAVLFLRQPVEQEDESDNKTDSSVPTENVDN
jgi:uncharacterized membrane protein YfcA